MTIHTKRIYNPPSDNDGTRVLVDRLWPRGVRKDNARIDLWPKEITPSNELRKWFHEDTAKHWSGFQHRYEEELESQPEMLDEIREMSRNNDITLITAAKDENRNHVVVLKKVLENGSSPQNQSVHVSIKHEDD
jgi:uncharacterized protein YeaO (DUF488 family)